MKGDGLRFLSLIFIVLAASTSSSPASEKCNQEAFWAGFSVHARANGQPKDKVLQIANITFPKQTFPELNKRSMEITNEVYSLWKYKLNKYKPFDQRALIKVEQDFKSICMKN